MYGKMTRIISRMSGRSFVGMKLARNEEWIALNVTYTRDVFKAAAKLREWKPILRPVVKYFIPEIRRVWENHTVATSILTPILLQKTVNSKQDSREKPVEALQWLRDEQSKRKKNDVALLANLTLALGAASIHTTSQLITNVIFDLAARPEYVGMLRDEVTEALNDVGHVWNQELLSKLQKLDSFIKETQRFSSSVGKCPVSNI